MLLEIKHLHLKLVHLAVRSVEDSVGVLGWINDKFLGPPLFDVCVFDRKHSISISGRSVDSNQEGRAVNLLQLVDILEAQVSLHLQLVVVDWNLVQAVLKYIPNAFY